MNASKFIVLNRDHKILVQNTNDGSALPVPQIVGLRAIQEYFAALGLNLGAPVGVRPPDFAFLLPDPIAPPQGHSWLSLSDAADLLSEEVYWKLYTEFLLGGFVPASRKVDVFSFGNSPFMASYLAHLVIKGRKRNTSGHLEAMKKVGAMVPTPKLLSIVTDFYGIPLCCIETERVDLIPFREIPETVAFGEGEGDLTLEDWRHGHWKYFFEEAARVGVGFTEESLIVNEWFKVIKVFGIV